MISAEKQVSCPGAYAGNGPFRMFFFSELATRRVCARNIKNRLGKLTDLVFAMAEPYPEAAGLYLEHGWNQPTEFIPWDKVIKIDDDAIFVEPPEGGKYPPFIDQPGWILLDKHLMGRTIVDLDGRRIEVVNDISLVEARCKLLLVDVDVSFNGFWRRWGLGRLHLAKSRLIPWKYVQPLSLEDAVSTDKVALSITRQNLVELPSEDLADVLEELSRHEQEAVFSALDSEKAADTLLEAEPRAQRQIITHLREEHAKSIFSEMTVPQLANIFSILPHDDVQDLIKVLEPEKAKRVHAILSEQETRAKSLMSPDFWAKPPDAKAGEVVAEIRRSGSEPQQISYIFVVDRDKTLLGVVDLRELVVTGDEKGLQEIMASPVVAAEESDLREDVAQIFAKYHFRMLPVVDGADHILGVIYYQDIMKDLVIRVA
ncbi:MAG: magnesium transporter MgtE N-terminal domain-containing protein [Desulfobaccales bacterium]